MTEVSFLVSSNHERGFVRASDAAFRDVYDCLYPQIHRYLLYKTHNREVSEELAATAFQVLWERPTDDGTVESAQRQLLRIAFRLQSHHWRTVERQRRLFEKLSGLAADRGEVFGDDAVDDLELLAVPSLLPRERAALHLIHCKTNGEAAEALDCNSNVLRITLSRARRKLHKHLSAIALPHLDR